MATYSPIAEINIGLNTTAATKEGFGIPLLLTSHSAFTDVVRVYGSLDDVLVDFSATDATYLAAAQVFNQTPSVTQLIIGNAGSGENSVIFTLTEDEIVTGETYTITILTTTADGVELETTGTIVATDTDTPLSVLEGLGVELSGDENITETAVEGEDGIPTLTIQPTDGTSLVITDMSSNLTSATEAPNSADALAALTEIMELNNDWYFLFSTFKDAETIESLSSFIEGYEKLYFTSLFSEDEVATASATEPTLGYQLAETGRLRTVTLFHQDENCPEGGWIGVNAPYDAGSVTWANNQISGLATSESPISNGTLTGYLTTTQKNNLMANNVNFLDEDGGITFTRTGVTVSGEWIDTIRGRDWLVSELQSALVTLLTGQLGGKVPYTDAGINQIRSVMETVLQEAVNRGFLESYTTSFPKASEISFADKQSRVLSGISFVGYLAGAIHEVTVEGNLTYSQGEV